jgi:hypothetical protein
MRWQSILIISIIVFGAIQNSYAQTGETERVLVVSDEEKIILFGGFSIAIIAIVLFLAKDIILRKKNII